MKTIKDLKNYVKSTSRIVLKDCIDTECFHYSEWAIIQDMKNKVKKKSKAIYKEFRDILTTRTYTFRLSSPCELKSL